MKMLKNVFLFLVIAGSFAAGAESIELVATTDAVVEFHILSGTGSAAWNKFNAPIVVSVGDTLRFVNDDSIAHYLHTDGSPCSHGSRMFGPGETYDCVISKKHNASDEDLYDHNQGPDAQVYIQAN